MRLSKETGGCTITWHGAEYAWETDGSVLDVPAALAGELLGIRGGGFSEAGPEPVTEPKPAAKAAVTEPAPAAKAPVTEVKPAK